MKTSRHVAREGFYLAVRDRVNVTEMVFVCWLQMTTANRFVQRLSIALALTTAILLLTSPEMTSSAPTRRRRTRHLAAYPATYSYHVRRMGRCRDDDRIFADCFFCGRLANEPRIYHGCCHRRPIVVQYCENLLS